MVTAAELREKVARGMWVGLRQGSSARNLRDLLPGVDPSVAHRCFLVSDDRSPLDLADLGHLDECLRICLAEGLSPVAAVTLATLNPAAYRSESNRGAVAPGYVADLVVFQDLQQFEPTLVFIDGQVVARDGEPLWQSAPVPPPIGLRASVHLDPVGADAFRVVLSGRSVRVIEANPGQLVTGASVRTAQPGAELAADPADDIAKVAVLERHHGSGRRSVGLVRGLGLRRGAIASTMAHDAHHLVVCGMEDHSMAAAADHVRAVGGGFAVAAGADVVSDLPLPVGGLLSDRPFPDVVIAQRRIRQALQSLTGQAHDPFDTLRFLALPVIPALKLSDQGLVDPRTARRVVRITVAPPSSRKWSFVG